MGINIQKSGPNQWFLDVRVKKHGKQCRKRETFHGTKAAAEERFVQLKTELRLGHPIISKKSIELFRDALDLY